VPGNVADNPVAGPVPCHAILFNSAPRTDALKKLCLPAILAAALLAPTAHAQQYSWQKPQAKILPTGEIEWAPEPFVFKKGQEVRYIDFEAGDDDRDGKTPATAWKRHPLDPAFKGRADANVDTYIFKRGVIYRGGLRGAVEGSPQRPIIFTSDPAWGQGEATIAGSEVVTGWKKGADHAKIPEREKVWYADLDFAPRNVWAVAADGKTTRIPLARDPNWAVTEPNQEDVMKDWYMWDQPEWWVDGKNVMNGKHLGISNKVLANRNADDLVGGLVWTEYGIVMGQPICVAIEGYDPARNGIAFEGPWLGTSEKIIAHNRFFLEDKPNFLDDGVNGEFWFDKKGEGGRLYLRMPGDADPNTARIEAAKQLMLMEFSPARHVEISGLSFRFTNVRWPMWENGWRHRDVLAAAIRVIEGDAENVTIANNRFENIHKAVRIVADNIAHKIVDVTVRDNDMRFLDHGAIDVSRNAGQGAKSDVVSECRNVRVLRNRIREAGHRMARADFGHTLVVTHANPSEIAGNVLDRVYGAGVFVFAGKHTGEKHCAPFARMLVYNNSVNQALLTCNDWGSIETWQGGPAYVFNNVSLNPCGYWNWVGNGAGARLGFAYYLDGAFKNYYFNNIAWGANNDPANPKLANAAAFYQAVPCILNAFFNNTAYRFLNATSWSPTGGRQLFLGNVYEDISGTVFTHGKQKEDADAQYVSYLLTTIGYSRNAFHKVPEEGTEKVNFGQLEGGFKPTDFAGFVKGAQAVKTLASDVGAVSAAPLLRDPANKDMRPRPGMAQGAKAVKFFVPWALSHTLGEWQFRRDNQKPNVVLDEHWWMTADYNDRSTYKDVARADLTGPASAITADLYSVGELEDWIPAALNLPARKVLSAELKIPAHETTPKGFTLEVYAKVKPGGRGPLVASENNEFALALGGDKLRFTFGAASVESAEPVAGDKLRHILCEYDGAEIRIYVDGKLSGSAPCAAAPKFETETVLVVGGAEATYEFLRVTLSSLAQSYTTIDELRAWQHDGPHLKDFTGKPMSANRPAGALDY